MYMHLFNPSTTDLFFLVCDIPCFLDFWYSLFSVNYSWNCMYYKLFSHIFNIWQWEVYSEILHTVERPATYIGVNGYQRRKTNLANNAFNKSCSALRKGVERVNKWITFIRCITAINKNYSFERSCTLDLKIVNLHNIW